MISIRSNEIPMEWVGKNSILKLMDLKDMRIPLQITPKEWSKFKNFIKFGKIPKEIPCSWMYIDEYLNIPIINAILTHGNKIYEFGTYKDEYLPLLKAQGYFYAKNKLKFPPNTSIGYWIHTYEEAADGAAIYGNFETLKWLLEHGATFTQFALDGVTKNGDNRTLEYLMKQPYYIKCLDSYWFM